MAFSTASSTVTMPVTYATLREKVGLREESASLGALVGSHFNNDGTALYEAMAALFIAQMTGSALALPQQALVLLTSVLASVGAAGIPEAGLVTMTLVFSAVHLPTGRARDQPQMRTRPREQQAGVRRSSAPSSARTYGQKRKPPSFPGGFPMAQEPLGLVRPLHASPTAGRLVLQGTSSAIRATMRHAVRPTILGELTAFARLLVADNPTMLKLQRYSLDVST
jgi:hypothetical protein